MLLDLSSSIDRQPPERRHQISRPAVIDLGCGSGVLAIAAAKLGWSEVWALDYDQLCIDATRENAQVNGVQIAAIERFDLREEEVPAADLVLANLLAPLLLLWARQMVGRSPSLLSGSIIASGLLRTEADAVAEAFAHGYDERRRMEQGDWAALLLTRRRPR